MRGWVPVLLTVCAARPAIGFHNSSGTSLGDATPVEEYEKLDKYAHCNGKVDHYMVYQKNLGLASKAVLTAGQDAGLLQQETVAIFGWTLGDYEFINKVAWGAAEVSFGVEPFGFPTCTLSKAEILPYIEVLVSGLNKLPPAVPATLWRGSKKSAEELGKLITGGFSSTSRDFGSAFNFVSSSGGSLWAIESHTSGKDISIFSDKPTEGEVLFAAGSRLEVVECSPTIITDEIRQKVKESEDEYHKKIDIICMKGDPSKLVGGATFIV